MNLNGYKIANPTVFARIETEEQEQSLRGCGRTPYFVEGHEPDAMHEAMAITLDTVVEESKRIQHDARANGNLTRTRWPMMVLKSQDLVVERYCTDDAAQAPDSCWTG